ncbi:protein DETOXIFICATION 46, chloroplastic-like isoform X4 [Ananas comosus]|uniref:Protein DETOXIFICATION 46, chloroplastic-like isoform X4 n=1 Tax=Ananas comosus TaxID=4615 RepID=A0A6P5F7A4_ANACO|nr:protein DETOXIFICATION 46, chloroplastic-like isoform X4 [Ananas comosus]
MALRLLAFSSSFSSSLLRFSPTTSPRSIPSSSSFPHLPSPSPSPSNPLSRTPHSNGAPRLRPISRSHAPGSDSGLAPLLPTDDGAAAAAAELAPSDSTSIWKQMKEIALFAGPATGLWICGPLMSLIDTMVIGQGSSLELAALAFTGPENLHIVPAANTYAQIRGFAWPAILVGMVAQSASLGMKDSWGPLKALTVASAINGFGDIFLCSICGYGIAGAALATMVSQVVAAFMMMQTLNKTGFQAFSMSIPSVGELFQIFEIAAPVFVTMTSKGKGGFVCFVLEKVSQGGALSYVAFYSLLTYFATSMGTITLAAHQVMINVFCMCTVWGEPLSQTAQSFMPELIHGVNRSLVKDILDS